MTISSFVQAAQSLFDAKSFRLAAVFLLCSGILLMPASSQVGLPRAAVSIPTDRELTAGMDAVRQCHSQGSEIVLPAVNFSLAGDVSSTSLFAAQAKAIASLPQESEVWLHMVVSAEVFTGTETEKQLTERVEAFLKPAPISASVVRGVIVEVNEPLMAPNQTEFALLRLAITAKSMRAGLRLVFVFGPGFIGQHGDLVKRLAIYSDLLGVAYSPSWRADAAWIAQEALNKPLVLKLDATTSAATSSYLGAALAASGSTVEIIWTEAPDARAAEQVCAMNSILKHHITANMLRLDPAALPFTIATDGLEDGEVQWFGSGQSPDTVIVAHVKGSLGQPKTVKLQATGGTQFEAQWYDPATGSVLPAGERVKAENGLVQTCACTSEYVLIAIHKLSGANTASYSSVEVKSGVDLTVSEVIARWQQYRAAQNRMLENYQSSSFMNLHFESTTVTAPFDISMQLTQFFSRPDQRNWPRRHFSSMA